MNSGSGSAAESKRGRRFGDHITTFVNRHKANIILYTGLAICVLAVWHFLSDGDFSFLMTLGSLMRTFGFAILVFKIYNQRSAAGVSLKTLILYTLVFCSRLCSILVYDGYLPFDRSGDWFYQFAEILSLVLVVIAIYLTGKLFRASYNSKTDVFGHGKYLPDDLAVLWLIVPAFLLALVLHPTLNNNFFTDVAWTFALYTEAVAVLPQLYMFHKKGGEVEAFTSHFVFTIGCARLMHFAFWLSSYHELNDRMTDNIGAQYPGYLVVLSQVAHLFIMVDFFYYYVKSLQSGGPLILPVSARVEV